MEPEAPNEKRRKKTAREKRKIRNANSKWREGTGSAKLCRTGAWLHEKDHYFGSFWRQVMRSKLPDVQVTPQAVRKFLFDLGREQSCAPSGPPTNEIIVVERDEDHITCRMVNDALERVDD